MPVTQWTGKEQNFWKPVGPTTQTIVPGIFKVNSGMMGWGLCQIAPKHDHIVRIGVADRIFTDIQKFWASKSQYKSFGFVHKRGFLLHSKPGYGKTIAAMLIATEVVKHRGIALLCSEEPEMLAYVLGQVREVHPEMPIICIWEDIDRWMSRDDWDWSGRSVLTAMLDGDSQIDNVVHIATTNFLDKLDSAFTNRPGRFDDVIELCAPDLDMRRTYLRHLAPNGDADTIEKIAVASDGLPLSHLKDTISCVFILGHTPDATVTRLKAMMEAQVAMDTASEEGKDEAPPRRHRR